MTDNKNTLSFTINKYTINSINSTTNTNTKINININNWFNNLYDNWFVKLF